ncbi:unnamed protein product, partial [Didymodactylos carnosus]
PSVSPASLPTTSQMTRTTAASSSPSAG